MIISANTFRHDRSDWPLSLLLLSHSESNRMTEKTSWMDLESQNSEAEAGNLLNSRPSLVYRVSSRSARATWWHPVSKTKPQQTRQTRDLVNQITCYRGDELNLLVIHGNTERSDTQLLIPFLLSWVPCTRSHCQPCVCVSIKGVCVYKERERC